MSWISGPQGLPGGVPQQSMFPGMQPQMYPSFGPAPGYAPGSLYGGSPGVQHPFHPPPSSHHVRMMPQGPHHGTPAPMTGQLPAANFPPGNHQPNPHVMMKQPQQPPQQNQQHQNSAPFHPPSNTQLQPQANVTGPRPATTSISQPPMRKENDGMKSIAQGVQQIRGQSAGPDGGILLEMQMPKDEADNLEKQNSTDPKSENGALQRRQRPSPWAMAATPASRLPSSSSVEPMQPMASPKLSLNTSQIISKPILSSPRSRIPDQMHALPPQQQPPNPRPTPKQHASPPSAQQAHALNAANMLSPAKHVSFADDAVRFVDQDPPLQMHTPPDTGKPSHTPPSASVPEPVEAPIVKQEPARHQNPGNSHQTDVSPTKEPHKTLRIDKVVLTSQERVDDVSERHAQEQQQPPPLVPIVRPQVQQCLPPPTAAALSSPRLVNPGQNGTSPPGVRNTAFTPVNRSMALGAPVGKVIVASRGVSPHAQCICMALIVKGISFDVLDVPPSTSADCPQWFKEASPNGMVPVLASAAINGGPIVVHGGALDVDAILALIDSLPSSAPRLVNPGSEQAVAEGVVMAKQVLIALEQVLADSKTQRETLAKLDSTLDALEALMLHSSAKNGGRKGQFFLGDGTALTLVDIWLAPSVARMGLVNHPRSGVDPQRTPLLSSYFANTSSLPEYTASAPSPERMTAAYKSEGSTLAAATPPDLQNCAMRALLQRLSAKSSACADFPTLKNILQMREMWNTYRIVAEAHFAMQETLGLPGGKEGLAFMQGVDQLIYIAFLSNGPARHTTAHACAQAFAQLQMNHEAVFRAIEESVLSIVHGMPREQYTALFSQAIAAWRGGILYMCLPTILDALTAAQAEQYATQVLNAMDEEEWRAEAVTAMKDGAARGVLRRDRIYSLSENIPDLAKSP